MSDRKVDPSDKVSLICHEVFAHSDCKIAENIDENLIKKRIEQTGFIEFEIIIFNQTCLESVIDRMVDFLKSNAFYRCTSQYQVNPWNYRICLGKIEGYKSSHHALPPKKKQRIS